MSLILCYCEKCGQVNDISGKKINNLINVTCTGCGNVGYLKPVPEEYLNNSGRGIKTGLHEKFKENVIKSSSNFDQDCWDRRVEIIYKRNDELLKNDKIERTNAPKCPTCQSTNIQKIGTGERVASVATLGIFSKKINKSFKCKNCGYTW